MGERDRSATCSGACFTVFLNPQFGRGRYFLLGELCPICRLRSIRAEAAEKGASAGRTHDKANHPRTRRLPIPGRRPAPLAFDGRLPGRGPADERLRRHRPHDLDSERLQGRTELLPTAGARRPRHGSRRKTSVSRAAHRETATGGTSSEIPGSTLSFIPHISRTRISGRWGRGSSRPGRSRGSRPATSSPRPRKRRGPTAASPSATTPSTTPPPSKPRRPPGPRPASPSATSTPT